MAKDEFSEQPEILTLKKYFTKTARSEHSGGIFFYF
jgi:hypothetical protein